MIEEVDTMAHTEGADPAASEPFPMLQRLVNETDPYVTLALIKEIKVMAHQRAELLEALKDAVGAFEYQVTLCHARDAAFLDKDVWARPMDYQEVIANMYAATAEPLTTGRTAIKAAS